MARALPDAAIHCATTPEEASPYLPDTEILYGWGFPAQMLKSMPRLRWLQKMGAGVDEIIEDWPFGPEVLLTRTAGELIAPRMTEYAVAAILDQSLELATARAQQRRHDWSYYEVGTIRKLTVGIAGVGEIGAAVGRAVRGLGARAIGWRRSEDACAGVDEVFAGNAALPRFAGLCDALVLVLPLTRETKGLFGARLLACCRRGAHIVNIGRGGVIDEAALLDALDTGLVGHATLDVFANEPLAPGHPFWGHPRVTVTPHICGPLVPEDVVPHFLANHAAFLNGCPLKNVIDIERQY
ncbi:MAG TPA: NAD(P)-dependent oxidoreductase [Xanthobacteraceae bacterium]